MIESLIFLLTTLLFAFILLYPFYLRDSRPTHYKGFWRVIGFLFKNRYGAIWVLNVYLAVSVFFIAGSFTQRYLIRLLAMLLYLALFTPIFLWYPYYLKEKRPERYKGIWRNIGKRRKDPRIAFPRWRK